MKKILITAYSLEMGGIEKALVNLIHILDKSKYEITLILEKKEGIFLDQIPSEVKVLEYRVFEHGNVLIRKIKNRCKLWKWAILNRNKYDFAISFATYSIPGSKLARFASSNNALWVHNNYYQLYEGNLSKIKKFFRSISANKFKKLVFVSKDNMDAICNIFSNFTDKSIVCNNIIDYKKIYELSNEKISCKKSKNILFVNVGRHEEHQKRLSRIIDACQHLKDDGYKFSVWFIGDGVDHDYYIKQVKKKKLEDVVLFLGSKKNPFPYYKIADAVLLSSEYEGYPVVFVEAMTLDKPIITTKVSDYFTVEGKYGIVVERSSDGVYLGMKQFIENGYSAKEKFSPQKFNKKIADILDDLFK